MGSAGRLSSAKLSFEDDRGDIGIASSPPNRGVSVADGIWSRRERRPKGEDFRSCSVAHKVRSGTGMNDSSTSRSILAIASAALIAAACSASASQPVLENEPASTDDSGAAEEQSAARKRPAKQSSTADAATEQAQSSDAGACDPIDDISEWITTTMTSDPPPKAIGGNIVDGTYVLTSHVIYGGTATTSDTRGTLRFQNDTEDFAYESPTYTRHTKMTYTTKGNEMSLTHVCKDGASDTESTSVSGYTATTTQFLSFSTVPGGMSVRTFTKQ